MTQKPRKKREKLSPKLKSESVPFRRSALEYMARHTPEKAFLQADFHFRPRRLSEKPRVRAGAVTKQQLGFGAEPSGRRRDPTPEPWRWRAGGRGAGEGSGGGAAPLRPASERVSEGAGVRALRGPAGGRAAAEDAEGRRRGPDSAGAAGRTPPEGVGRPRGRARAEPRALRSVRWLAPSLARSLAPSFRGGGGTRRRRRRRPGSRHGGRPEPGVDLLAAALLDVRDHQGRPGLLHQVSGRAGEVARGGGGAAGASGPGDPWVAPHAAQRLSLLSPAARRPRAPPGCTRSPARPWSPGTGGRAQVGRAGAAARGHLAGVGGAPGSARVSPGAPFFSGFSSALGDGALFLRPGPHPCPDVPRGRPTPLSPGSPPSQPPEPFRESSPAPPRCSRYPSTLAARWSCILAPLPRELPSAKRLPPPPPPTSLGGTCG